MNSKFIDIEGQVIKRIFNPERISKKDKPYKVNYLVLKWTSGPNGEYTDYVPIKTMEAKKMAEVRAGNLVRVTVQYRCGIYGNDVEYRQNSYNGVTTTEPKLYPEFSLAKNNEIEIIDAKENWEQNEETNTQFQNQVVNSTPPPPGEDDLPF